VGWWSDSSDRFRIRPSMPVLPGQNAAIEFD
jgi:hypothetical protein